MAVEYAEVSRVLSRRVSQGVELVLIDWEPPAGAGFPPDAFAFEDRDLLDGDPALVRASWLRLLVPHHVLLVPRAHPAAAAGKKPFSP
mmetsp:Transcript_37449/g.95706  ORF Transcript_37449/g.95706 Transcript_37449/m.95706 type:complete len:88 (+) Transcript_37449:223-486(+)